MSSRKIVITGVNGFVGRHLTRELHQHNIEVIGVDRASAVDDSISDLLAEYISVDLVDGWPEINDVSAVIHLAGLAAVGPSFEKPQEYINVNSAILTNLAEYYLCKVTQPRLIVISSGAIYSPDQPMPLTEDSKVGYTSPYAVSKVLVENQCRYYRTRNLDCVVARPFNHIGPGQRGGFLLPDLYEQLTNKNELSVGNLKTKRDYTDVRDVVKAYRLLATTETLSHDIYNICSGGSTSGEEILSALIDTTGKKTPEITVDEAKVRPNDPENIFGDNSRLQEDTGWRPELPLRQTIKDFVKSS
jgi:GDP-4-dehydro-6-deoxy-D-mannose reductase